MLGRYHLESLFCPNAVLYLLSQLNQRAAVGDADTTISLVLCSVADCCVRPSPDQLLDWSQAFQWLPWSVSMNLKTWQRCKML